MPLAGRYQYNVIIVYYTVPECRTRVHVCTGSGTPDGTSGTCGTLRYKLEATGPAGALLYVISYTLLHTLVLRGGKSTYTSNDGRPERGGAAAAGGDGGGCGLGEERLRLREEGESV